MQTRAKRKVYNILMAAVILLIVASGIMLTGHLKGWFGGSSVGSAAGGDASLVCTETTGVVQVERSGVGYTLKEDTVMRDGDIIATKNESQAVLAWQDDQKLGLNEKSELTIETCAAEGIILQFAEGELFADMQGSSTSVTIKLGDDEATVTGGIFSISEQSGAGTVCVYAGEATVLTQDGQSLSVAAGEQILLTENEKGEQVADITEMAASSLSPYIIEQLLACEGDAVCFSKEDLEGVVTARETQKAEADKALEQASIKIAEDQAAGDAADGGGQTADGRSSGAAASGSSSGSGGNSGSGSGGQDTMTCTVTISCSAILDNMENLAAGKDRYVPANGIILGTTPVEFRQGETAYDVTKRACEAMGIQIEASYVPLYGSYYVEGINHLYEFDCGGMSGWLYFVNGWSPNYGCSEYVLKDGDSIVWEYTCTGN